MVAATSNDSIINGADIMVEFQDSIEEFEVLWDGIQRVGGGLDAVKLVDSEGCVLTVDFNSLGVIRFETGVVGQLMVDEMPRIGCRGCESCTCGGK